KNRRSPVKSGDLATLQTNYNTRRPNGTVLESSQRACLKRNVQSLAPTNPHWARVLLYQCKSGLDQDPPADFLRLLYEDEEGEGEEYLSEEYLESDDEVDEVNMHYGKNGR
ncbi:hypothetical protein evm_014994, partial [Chilo suppressalis]